MTLAVFEEAADGLEAEARMQERLRAAEGPPRFLIWRAARRGLVLPAAMARGAAFDDAARESAARGWPVTTRPTGGGITPQGPGVVNLALAFRTSGADESIADGYDRVCAPLLSVLAGMGVAARRGDVAGSFCDGADNLKVAGRKLVGTAQRWRAARDMRGRHAALAHALVLTTLDCGRAVEAIQRFSRALGRPEQFRPEVHVTLAELVPGRQGRFAAALAREVSELGYLPA